MLTPTLKAPSDLLNKLIREQYRSFHAPHATHVADHLYNFCVTAIALRDCLFEELSFDDDAKDAFNREEWPADPARVACIEIANTMKHWTLRIQRGKRRGELKKIETRAAAVGAAEVVNVYVQGDTGAILPVKATKPTIKICLSDADTIDAWELTNGVVAFWRGYFATHGVPHTEQSEAEFFGEAESDEHGEYEVMSPLTSKSTSSEPGAGTHELERGG